MSYVYEKDGAAIYRRSFAIIRSEARLDRFDPADEKVAVRIIHASGMVDIAGDIVFSPGFSAAAAEALRAGAPIFCDAQMVANGVTRARLPAGNDVICTLSDPRAAASCRHSSEPRAARRRWNCGATGSRARWSRSATLRPRCSACWKSCGSRTCLPPAAIIGIPVGFVGAAESKEALLTSGLAPCVIVRGRRGGSAMAAAAVNALASETE